MVRMPSCARTSALALATLLALAGCAGPSAPVSERSGWDGSGRTVHVVQRGETLYSIAWRYGLDWRRLARRNGIPPPYTIHPGDRIRLRGMRADSDPSRASRSERGGSSTAGEAAGVADRASPRRPAPGEQGLRWSWPLQGEVIRGFSPDSGALNKGLDIRGENGAPLTSAAAGEVVYAGSGLRGYGRLVIVRHVGDWLSAYAHNHPIVVREGQRVDRGEVIAEIAGEGDRARTVHFEIRHRGDPVDPAELLPPR